MFSKHLTLSKLVLSAGLILLKLAFSLSVNETCKNAGCFQVKLGPIDLVAAKSQARFLCIRLVVSTMVTLIYFWFSQIWPRSQSIRSPLLSISFFLRWCRRRGLFSCRTGRRQQPRLRWHKYPCTSMLAAAAWDASSLSSGSRKVGIPLHCHSIFAVNRWLASCPASDLSLRYMASPFLTYGMIVLSCFSTASSQASFFMAGRRLLPYRFLPRDAGLFFF